MPYSRQSTAPCHAASAGRATGLPTSEGSQPLSTTESAPRPRTALARVRPRPPHPRGVPAPAWS
eukprot:7170560-Alexandrium_andersonii.AAC.1